MKTASLFHRQTPAVAKRGVHLDLKGLPPTPQRFVELLKLFAAARYNVVLVEWEDSFPWTVDERFRSPTAYTTEDVALFCRTAEEVGLELIPLVQCLGHMETPLSVAGYEHLREVADNQTCLNPLAAGARELVQAMVDDVLKWMPNVRYFHLGGDEARWFGANDQTKRFVAEHGKGALYLHHVGPILETLGARGIRPILWHDMMIDWDSAALRALAGQCDLMAWGYQGHPDRTKHHHRAEILQRLHAHGLTLWGATAYKGAEGYDADVPDVGLHVENAQGWVDVAERYGLVGIVATAWSRYAVDTLQCNPIDSSLDSLVMVAAILHDGAPLEGGVEACAAALDELGEGERFRSCRQAMARLAAVRRRGWQKVQHTRQVLVLGRMDRRRTSARNRTLGLHWLGELEAVVKQAEQVADEVRQSFDGLIDRIWIEEYLATRLMPLAEELDQLQREAER